MRHFKQLCAAVVLTLAIVMSAFAGNMQAGITDPPPPPPSATTQGNMAAGCAGNMETTSSITTTDSVTAIALSLFLALF